MAILSKLWTSSHGRKNLPEAIFSAFEKQKRFEIPEIIYKPGLKLTKDVVSEIKETVKKQNNSAQVHVLILGDNDFRRLEGDPRLYLTCVEDLVQFFKDIPKAHLVLVSLLPSPKTNDQCKDVFYKMSEELKKYGQEDPDSATYLRVTKEFMKAGIPEQELYFDGIHLSVKGANVLASAIKKYLMKIPDKCFS